jgi:hypothetical protein
MLPPKFFSCFTSLKSIGVLTHNRHLTRKIRDMIRAVAEAYDKRLCALLDLHQDNLHSEAYVPSYNSTVRRLNKLVIGALNQEQMYKKPIETR